MDEKPAVAPVARKPRRRWWFRIVWLLSALTVTAVGVYLYLENSASREWDAAVAEAGQDMPRWQLMVLEGDRPMIPDGENSALHIIAVNRVRGGTTVWSTANNYDQIFDNLPANAQLNEQQVKLIRDQLAKMPKAVEMARKLKDMPRGRFPITYADDGISTLIPEHQEARGVADLLRHDAMLLAQEGKYDDAALSCLACFNVGRSFEGDLFPLALLLRAAMHNSAIMSLERVLAQGEASEKTLEKLQQAMLSSAKEDHWLTAMRGHRALMHHGLENIRAGKAKASAFNDGRKSSNGKSLSDLATDLFPSKYLRHYPAFLRYMNRVVEVSKLPSHERGPKLRQMAEEMDKSKNPLLLFSSFGIGIQSAEGRSQAILVCAAVGLACERYRLNKKAWPATLEVLVKEKYLEAIPLDPADGKPLRYGITKDGVVIYSALWDEKGNLDRDRPFQAGADIGFHLWRLERRRQPPLPPVAEKED